MSTSTAIVVLGAVGVLAYAWIRSAELQVQAAAAAPRGGGSGGFLETLGRFGDRYLPGF